MTVPPIEDFQNYYTANLCAVGSPFYGLNYAAFDFLNSVLQRLKINITYCRVLDVGCGLGKLSEYANRKNATYVGMDITVTLARLAKDQAPQSGVYFGVADAQRLPFPDKSFDYIFCVDVFEHLAHQDWACAEFSRILKDKGAVFLSVPNYSNVCGILKLWQEKFGGFKKNTWSPFSPDTDWTTQVLEQFMTPVRVRRIFRDASFSHFDYLGHEWGLAAGLFPWVWHPQKSELVKRTVNKLVRYIQAPVTRILPFLSLNNFWRITKE